jgi:hypothetical protein
VSGYSARGQNDDQDRLAFPPSSLLVMLTSGHFPCGLTRVALRGPECVIPGHPPRVVVLRARLDAIGNAVAHSE